MVALAFKLDGLSIKTSKQSIITATFFPKPSWKQIGVVFCKLSQSGQRMRSCNLMFICINHLEITLDVDIPNW